MFPRPQYFSHQKVDIGLAHPEIHHTDAERVPALERRLRHVKEKTNPLFFPLLLQTKYAKLPDVP